MNLRTGVVLTVSKFFQLHVQGRRSCRCAYIITILSCHRLTNLNDRQSNLMMAVGLSVFNLKSDKFEERKSNSVFLLGQYVYLLHLIGLIALPFLWLENPSDLDLYVPSHREFLFSLYQSDEVERIDDLIVYERYLELV